MLEATVTAYVTDLGWIVNVCINVCVCVCVCIFVFADLLSLGCLLPEITAVITMAMMMVNDDDCHLSGDWRYEFVCVSCVSKGMFEGLTRSSRHKVTAGGLWVIGSVFSKTM